METNPTLLAHLVAVLISASSKEMYSVLKVAVSHFLK